jgi:hypothetical protein
MAKPEIVGRTGQLIQVLHVNGEMVGTTGYQYPPRRYEDIKQEF